MLDNSSRLSIRFGMKYRNSRASLETGRSVAGNEDVIDVIDFALKKISGEKTESGLNHIFESQV